MRTVLVLFGVAVISACAQSRPAADDVVEPGPRGASNPREGSGAGPGAGSAARSPIELSRCEGGGWCWAHGAPINAVHGAEGKVVAVGAQGTVLEWTPEGWQRSAEFTRASL